MLVTEPIEGSETAVVTPAQLGGTRHLSAAQFVQDQRDAIALVASQDGRFTIFTWSPREDVRPRAPRRGVAAVAALQALDDAIDLVARSDHDTRSLVEPGRLNVE